MSDSGRTPAAPDAYRRELEAVVDDASDAVARAIAAGRASRDVVRRVALEWACVARWTTAELPLLVAGAPDVHSFTLDHSTHYRHWARTFAERAGYLGAPGQARAILDWCRQLGLEDVAIRAYRPLPETIAMTCTLLFYVRRSYAEGVAVLAYAGERVLGRAGHAPALADGLARHYGWTAPRPPEPAPSTDDAAALLADVATAPLERDRCRDAVRNVLATAACRVGATARWIE